MGFSAGKNLQTNINTTEAQTLQNKTLDSTNTVNDAPINNSTITGASLESPSRLDMKQDTLANLQTYAATATNGQLVFATDTKQTFQVVDAALLEVGGGAAGVNYISNPDFEQGIDGYTDDVNFTLAQTEVVGEVLRDNASGKLSKAAVDASDEEISIPFTVDRGDLAKKLTISFDYDASDVNYADNDILIGVRQDPNGTPSIIRINGEDLKGGKGTHYAQFQTDASIDEYELFFKVNSTNASAYDVIIDDVKVGPREVAFGSLVTDWKSYTPTWESTGTSPSIENGTLEGFYKRVGDSIKVQIKLFAGSSTTFGTGNYSFTLPSGLSMDTSKLFTSDGSRDNFGTSTLRDSSSAQVMQGTVRVEDSSSVNVLVYDNSTNPNTLILMSNSAPITLAQDDKIYIEFEAPIEGWSSNAASSEDLGSREVVVEGRGNGGTSITANVTDIDFTETRDTTASFNGTQFTAPETGEYLVVGVIRFNAIIGGQVSLYIDGGVSTKSLSSNVSASRREFQGVAFLNKGEVLSIRHGVSGTLVNDPFAHNIHIQKLTSPQTILETETVAARYTSNSGQSIPNGSNTVVIYEDIVSDTHNAYDNSTGVYTVPVSGFYQINAHYTLANSAVSAGNQHRILLIVDGVDVERVFVEMNGTNASNSTSPKMSTLLYLEKGQEVQIEAFQNSGASTTLLTNGIDNVFSVSRLK